MVYIFGEEVVWQDVVDWFLAQPLYGQILIIVGAVAILALAVVIVYYVIKGVAYLVYYVLKGVYYLLKGIGLLFYKIFEALYYAISGKPKPGSQDEQSQVVIQKPIQVYSQPPKLEQVVEADASFCTECGSKFSDNMMMQLREKGFVYCIHCGKSFKSNYVEINAQ
jgi:hypothetical protein